MSSKDHLKVVHANFENKPSVEEEILEARKVGMLEVIDELRRRVEAGDMTEFVGASTDAQGEVNIHIYALDIPGAVGMFEIGKNILLNQYE
jgi:hypothetical protein